VNKDEIAKAFPPGVNTETDNIYGALVDIAACFILLTRRDKEIGPKFMSVVKNGMNDPAKVDELRLLTLDISCQFRNCADALLDAAVTLDIALLDRAAAGKNVC